MQHGLLAVRNNAEVDQLQAQQYAYRSALDAPPPDPHAHLVTHIGAYIDKCLEASKNSRSEYDRRLIECAHRRDGTYLPEKIAQIEESGQPLIYMQLTPAKCTAAESWICDVILSPGERPFSIQPTPIPSMPPQLQQQLEGMVAEELQLAIQSGLYLTSREIYERQRAMYDMLMERIREEAETRAKRMEDKIHDLLTEGGFYDALRDFISYLCAFPIAILKGPVYVRKPTLKWVEDPMAGGWAPKVEMTVVPTFTAPHPRNIYWSPDSRSLQDGYVVEEIPYRRNELHAMKGVAGYKPEMIDAALDEYQKGFTPGNTHEQRWRNLEGQTNWQMSPEQPITATEFRGRVPAAWLIQWGMDAARFPDPMEEFEISALKVGRFVVKCVLNEDVTGERPYSTAYYDVVPNQITGRALPEKIADCQDMCNASTRALAANLGIASGPQVEVSVDRLAEGEQVTELYPWKIWQTKEGKSTSPSPAVRFWQAEAMAEPLLRVYEHFAQQADEQSGIPRYQQGVNAGMADTATAQTMIMNASTRQVKEIVASVDKAISTCVARVYNAIMKSPGFEDLKCDANVVPKGAGSLLVKEQLQIRRQEFLDRTNNDVDMSIIGTEGRAELLRSAAKSLDIPADKVIPSRERLVQRAVAQSRTDAVSTNASAVATGQDPAAVNAAGSREGGQDVNTAQGQPPQ